LQSFLIIGNLKSTDVGYTPFTNAVEASGEAENIRTLQALALEV